MCLIYCTALNLLQAIEMEEQGRRTGRWNRDEGKKVVNVLGEKSLIKTSTFEGSVKVTNHENKAILLRFLENHITDFFVKTSSTCCCQ